MTQDEIAQLSNNELKAAMRAAGLAPKTTLFDVSKLPKPSAGGGYAKADIDQILSDSLKADVARWREELAEYFAKA